MPTQRGQAIVDSEVRHGDGPAATTSNAIYTISVPTTPDTFACQWYDSKYDGAVVSAELTAPDLSLCTLLLYCSGCGRRRCCSVLCFAVFTSCDLITVVMSCLRDASHAPSCEGVGV